MRQTTLKDIAKALGVSATTVHRALYDKGGISVEMRDIVLKEASERGYKANYAASSLKRHPIVIAAVLPSKEGSGRFYYKYLWESIMDCQENSKAFNIKVITRSYEDSSDDHCRVLTSLFEEYGSQLNGLLTLPISADEKTIQTLNKFCYAGISIVLFDIDIPVINRLCCVAPHEFSNGELAAEVLSLITNENGKVLIAGGSENNISHINTIKGFTNYITKNSIGFDPLIIHGYEDDKRCYDLAVKALQEHDDIVAFFGGTAREIIPLCQAVVDCNLAGKIKGIGNDLFKESAQLLNSNVLQAVIDKNNYKKGIIGFNALFDHYVKKLKTEKEFLQVPTKVVVKGNLSFYLDRL